MRGMVIFAIFIQYMCCPVFADDIQTCGDLGTDNRPNWCARPNGAGGLVQGKSECRKISDTQFEYTHCSGSKQTYTGDLQCCVESTQCPGAFYIAICVH